MLLVLELAVTLTVSALCAEEKEPGRDKCGCGMKGPGQGMGSGYMKPHGWQSTKPG